MNAWKKSQYLFFVSCSVFALMYGAYFQGRESGITAGIVVGVEAGFDAGYKAKKPPVIILTPPPRPGGHGAIVPKQPDKDSVLWRI